MSGKKQNPEQTETVEDAVVSEQEQVDAAPLPHLNERQPNCIGILHMTPNLHARLQDQVEELRRRNVSNLWWIAAMLCDYGTRPIIEDVFQTAPAVATDPDSFIYNRDMMPDGYQDDSGRQPVSSKQWRNISENSARLLDNAAAIKDLEGAGYNADHLTARELFQDLENKARVRDVTRKAAEDNAKLAKDAKMRAAAEQTAEAFGFKL